jgi:hypothetical protein
MINDLLVKGGDACFGWMLTLGRDLPLVIVAILTALLIVAARRFATNQTLLSRCHRDRRRLAELIRQARSQRDRPALARYKRTLSQLRHTMLRQEFRPLLVLLIPIAFLATWCFDRLEYLPLRPGETIRVSLYRPASADGQFAHIVPLDGLEAGDGWIQRFAAEPGGSELSAARWKLTASAAGAYQLIFRYQDQSFAHRLVVGDGRYALPIQYHDSDQRSFTRVELAPRRLFGTVPGLPWRGFAPWVVGYLLLTIPMYPVLRRLLRVS